MSESRQDLRYQLDAPMRKVRKELGLPPLEPDWNGAVKVVDHMTAALERASASIRRSGKRLTSCSGPR